LEAHGPGCSSNLPSPAGWLGRLAERLALARYMQTLIEQRNQYLAAQAIP
jgi:hypothetical protein